VCVVVVEDVLTHVMLVGVQAFRSIYALSKAGGGYFALDFAIVSIRRNNW
jgi:hypothetical protein